MLTQLLSYLQGRAELAFGASIFILYLTYYFVNVVKLPVLICGEGELRDALEQMPLLRQRFWATPWCVHGLLQTGVASVVRGWLMPRLPCERRLVRLRDGGTVCVDRVFRCPRPRRALLVLPGLTGDATADYVRLLLPAARHLRAHLLVFNNRGLGGLPLTTAQLYSAVSHEDLSAAVEAACAEGGAACGLPLVGVGVSLGGLILGHHLAETGAASRFSCALLVSSPLDVEAGAALLERMTYAPVARLLAHKAVAAAGRHACIRSTPQWRAAESARSLRAFDAALTAPSAGFSSVEEYYRAASLARQLPRMRVPVLCVCAADDPLQPLSAVLARPAEAALNSPLAALLVTPRGGHIGFLRGLWPFASASPDDQFLTELLVQFVTASDSLRS